MTRTTRVRGGQQRDTEDLPREAATNTARRAEWNVLSKQDVQVQRSSSGSQPGKKAKASPGVWLVSAITDRILTEVGEKPYSLGEQLEPSVRPTEARNSACVEGDLGAAGGEGFGGIPATDRWGRRGQLGSSHGEPWYLVKEAGLYQSHRKCPRKQRMF